MPGAVLAMPGAAIENLLDPSAACVAMHAGGTLVVGREQDCEGGCFDSARGAAGDIQVLVTRRNACLPACLPASSPGRPPACQPASSPGRRPARPPCPTARWFCGLVSAIPPQNSCRSS